MARVPPGQAKEAIMAIALGATGLFDFLERLEKGENPVSAAKDAVHGLQRRGKVIKRVSREMNAKPPSGFSCGNCDSKEAVAGEFANGRPAWQCQCGHLNPRNGGA